MQTSNLLLNRKILAITVMSTFLTACGGGGGNTTSQSGIPAANPNLPAANGGAVNNSVSTKTTIVSQVIDGAIEGAIVCLDKNQNNQCDTDEPQGKTDKDGKASFDIEKADAGKYPLVAFVGADANDADHGRVGIPFVMTTIASETSMITPFTTMVHQTTENGATKEEAIKSVEDLTGIKGGLFKDPTKDPSSKALARLIVLINQQVTDVMSSAIGAEGLDKKKITQSDIIKMSKSKGMELLPSIVANLGADGGNLTADALKQSAASIVSSANLTKENAKDIAVLARAAQNAPTSGVKIVPGPYLRNLEYTDPLNYYARYSNSVSSEPDSDNKIWSTDRRYRSQDGKIAKWAWPGSSNPSVINTHFNGKIWRQCEPNNLSPSTILSATLNSRSTSYDYCDGYEKGVSTSKFVDISNQSMLGVYNLMRNSGLISMSVQNPEVAFGGAAFPAGSYLLVLSGTSTSSALTYKNLPFRSWNVMSGPVGDDVCSGGSFSKIKTLESFVSQFNAKECDVSGRDPFFAGTEFVQGRGFVPITAVNEAATRWTNLFELASLPGPAVSMPSPSYFNGKALIAAGFPDPQGKRVNYYKCSQRSSDGSLRACVKIQEGTYSFELRDDARVLSLNNLPVVINPAGWYRVPVERKGYVYAGTQSILLSYTHGRFNVVGSKAFAERLGIIFEADYNVPLKLTAGSYAGSYDLYEKADLTGNRLVVKLNIDGTASCQNAPNENTWPLASSTSCTMTINDPEFDSSTKGKFTLVHTASGKTVTMIGTIDYMAGTVITTSSSDSIGWSGYREY